MKLHPAQRPGLIDQRTLLVVFSRNGTVSSSMFGWQGNGNGNGASISAF
jgi:hypothetical protein